MLAQAKMGMAYLLGEGVEADPVRSYMWLELSSTAGSENAKLAFESVAGILTEDQKVEGRKLADQWRADHAGGGAGSGS